MTGSSVPDPEWKATAIADPLIIVDYISDENPAAAQALKDEIEDRTSSLADHPQMHRVGHFRCPRVAPGYVPNRSQRVPDRSGPW